MNAEELFLAIGQVEDSRLLRSEKQIHSASASPNGEDRKMKARKPGRILRTLLVAAVLVSLLAVTAYAVAGFLIFESPEQMLTAIFGDNTGFDHSEGSIRKDPYGGPEGILVEPTFDRVSVEEEVAEGMTAHVEIVGQSLSANGYTLTVDAFLYDSTTRCGIVTYLLENPEGLLPYNLQSTGEIWYNGRDPVQINQYGYPYLLQEKTTDTCLAVTYYFMADDRRGETLELCLSEDVRYTPQMQEELLRQTEDRLRAEMTRQEVLDLLLENLGQEYYVQVVGETGEDAMVEQAYQDLAMAELGKRMEDNVDCIRVDLARQDGLNHVTLGGGGAVITPISLRLDVRPYEFLADSANDQVSTDNVDSVVIRYKDGEEYVVGDGYIINTVFVRSDYPENTVMTEHIVTPEEDPAGEGFAYMQSSEPRCFLTMAFNRLVDVERIQSLILNGVELTVD